MAWWHGAESLVQGQLLIVDKAISDVRSTPSGAMVWVQGCAGTGKTLVLAHIALRLAAMGNDKSVAFLTYTHALKGLISKTVGRSSVPITISTYKTYLSQGSARTDIILIDEIQDVSKEDLLKLRSRCTHLIVAGDCEQRIYEQGSSESEIDEKVRFSKYRLVQLFRVTKSIVELAKKILSSTLLVRGDVPEGQIDVDIAVRSFETQQQEARWVYEEAIAFARPGYPSAILFPKHSEILRFCQLLASDLGIADSGPKIEIIRSGKSDRIADYAQLNSHFDHHSISAGYFGNNIGQLEDSETRPFVYLMTYHSAKGLDFSTVFLPRLTAGTQIGVPSNDLGSALFFVAVTRARERLIVTYTGREPYSQVRLIPNFESRVVQHNADEFDDDEGLF